MKEQLNLTYDTKSQRQVLDVYLPEDGVNSVFVYFHGGGLVEGDKSDGKRFASYLTERKIALVAANYRIYPTHAFPDFLYDAATSVPLAAKNAP